MQQLGPDTLLQRFINEKCYRAHGVLYPAGELREDFIRFVRKIIRGYIVSYPNFRNMMRNYPEFIHNRSNTGSVYIGLAPKNDSSHTISSDNSFTLDIHAKTSSNAPHPLHIFINPENMQNIPVSNYQLPNISIPTCQMPNIPMSSYQPRNVVPPNVQSQNFSMNSLNMDLIPISETLKKMEVSEKSMYDKYIDTNEEILIKKLDITTAIYKQLHDRGLISFVRDDDNENDINWPSTIIENLINIKVYVNTELNKLNLAINATKDNSSIISLINRKNETKNLDIKDLCILRKLIRLEDLWKLRISEPKNINVENKQIYVEVYLNLLNILIQLNQSIVERDYLGDITILREIINNKMRGLYQKIEKIKHKC